MSDISTYEWTVGNETLRRTSIPLLMGILNVTPDSFSDGGQHSGVEAAVAHGIALADAGADIIDIGGESTRPGADPVDIAEELRRTIPVIRELAGRVCIPLSIDTTKAEVARQAMDAGALIVNDISGLTFDEGMISVCCDHNAAVCAMHIKGTPQSMQDAPHYDDVVAEVCEFLHQRLQVLTSAGLKPSQICLDPGIGFGKTAEHNLQLMQALPHLRNALSRPVLIGHSRKRFLSSVLGRSVEERLAGTLGVSIALAELGADILRVHDVRATRDALVAHATILAGSHHSEITGDGN